MLSGITARFFPEAALQFVWLLQGKLRDGVENLKLNPSNGFICICFSFLPIGLCTAAFPTEADAGGGSFPVSVLSLQETLIALPRSLITSAVSSEKMQSIFSSPESKIGGVFSKLIASNLRRAY